MIEIISSYFPGLSPQQEQQFSQLKEIYSEWNEKINVISRKDFQNFEVHHVLHSLSIATRFKFEDGARILDIGTGGGFPGVPLAIMFPNVQFHLVDSINKKLIVVNEVATALNIKNITTAHTRVEDIRNHKFDSVVSRAVAPLKDLWHWSKPLIYKTQLQQSSPHGLICLKGGDLAAEIAESNCKPYIWEIEKTFSETYFNNKFLLYQPLKT